MSHTRELRKYWKKNSILREMNATLKIHLQVISVTNEWTVFVKWIWNCLFDCRMIIYYKIMTIKRQMALWGNYWSNFINYLPISKQAVIFRRKNYYYKYQYLHCYLRFFWSYFYLMTSRIFHQAPEKDNNIFDIYQYTVGMTNNSGSQH